MTRLFLISLFFLESAFAQEVAAEGSSLNFLVDVLGKKGIILTISIILFLASYRNSVRLFAWIEDQTYGTRDYILSKCELLFWEVEPIKITYLLLFLTFGLGSITFSLFAIFGIFKWGAILGVLLAVAGWKVPRPLMDYLVERRIKKYEGQMTDGLNLLSNGLRAGLSVPQSVGLVVDELPKPISQEFGLILQQAKIGVPLDEAFGNLAVRVPTEDNDMFVSSISILRETGGNLAEVFDTIAAVIRERVRLKQKIETYVAQGKMQGGVIASMPTAMLLYFGSSDPRGLDLALNTVMGNIGLLIALVLNVGGGVLMMKVIKIKV